jgi:tetratricopeptide (TPR) repeat protein
MWIGAGPSKIMNWDRYNELLLLRDSGHPEEAIAELTKLSDKEQDPLAKSIALLAIADGLVGLKHLSAARDKIRAASEILGPNHEFYPRVAFKAAILDMQEKKSSEAFRNLSMILKNYEAVLRMEDHKDLWEEVQRNRGIALADLRRFREALPILECFRSEPYERDRTLYYLGACEFELDDFDAAKRDFQEMMSLGSDSVFGAYAHRYLGTIFFRQGQLARAKGEFEECLASPHRDKKSDINLLGWLINTCTGLNLHEDAARYRRMQEGIRSGEGALQTDFRH